MQLLLPVLRSLSVVAVAAVGLPLLAPQRGAAEAVAEVVAAATPEKDHAPPEAGSGKGGGGGVPPLGRALSAAAAPADEAGPYRPSARRLPGGTVRLDFEGLADGQQVGNFYGGGAGPNYGIVYGESYVASVSRDAGGSGLFPPAPSPNTTITYNPFNGEFEYMTVDAGFTAISLKYSVYEALGFVLYDGPNLTGNVLHSEQSPRRFREWNEFAVQLSGGAVAKSMSLFQPGSVPNLDDVVVTLVSLPPSKPPTNAPTTAPTANPTNTPTKLPTLPPTTAPTASPTRRPTKVPTSLPACNGTSFWAYNADTNAVMGPLVNSSATCLLHPYSVEVRPCLDGATLPADAPVTTTLVRRRRRLAAVVVHRQVDGAAPYFLFGGGSSSNDVRWSPGQLPDGSYRLSARFEGGGEGAVVAFAQSCSPCAKVPKGKKGCMKRRALKNRK